MALSSLRASLFESKVSGWEPGEDDAKFQGQIVPDAKAAKKGDNEEIELLVPVGPGGKPDKR
ncbi:MAG: hypothetical protein QM703_27755 [Gemmatales bacterium]